MSTAVQISIGFADILEIEDTVDDRLHSCYVDSAVHSIEHGAASDPKHSFECDCLSENGRGIDLSLLAGEHTDEVDVTVDARRTERSFKCARPADLNDVIDAFAVGKSEHRLVPVGRRLVVDRLPGTQFTGAIELLVA